MGQDSHLADSTKAVRLLLGVDDNDPDQLRFVPRFPAEWTRMSIDEFPVLTGDRRQKCGYVYERLGDHQVFSWTFEHSPERMSVRLGPIPAAKSVQQARVNGEAHPFIPIHSGDSDWVWVEGLGGEQGRIEIEIE
jgi:hypothetical protein